MKKYIHNMSPEVVRVVGIEVDPGQVFEFPSRLYDKGTYDESLRTNVAQSKLLLSKDGINILTPEESLKLLDRLYLADQVSFVDGASVETSVQEALESLDLSSVGSIVPMSFQRNGTAKNRWLDTAHGIDSYECPQSVPFACRLVGITAVNRKSSADYVIRVYCEPVNTSGFSEVESLHVSNSRSKTKTNLTEINISAGSAFAVYIQDAGADPQDIFVTLYFKVTSNSTGEY